MSSQAEYFNPHGLFIIKTSKTFNIAGIPIAKNINTDIIVYNNYHYYVGSISQFKNPVVTQDGGMPAQQCSHTKSHSSQPLRPSPV